MAQAKVKRKPQEQPEPPAIPLVCLDAIPSEMQAYAHWVLWKRGWESDDKNWRKIPVNAKGLWNASSRNPNTWTTFSAAKREYEKQQVISPGMYGIGYVMTKVNEAKAKAIRPEHEDDLVFLDLDHCIDPDTGEIADWAWDIVKMFNTYTEISPSGTGLHLYFRGRIPQAYKTETIEIYEALRFTTLTGAHLEGTPLDICDAQSAADVLVAELEAKQQKGKQRPKTQRTFTPLTLADEDLISRIRDSAQREKFHQLYDEGELDGSYHYPSHSEGVFAFLRMLAFWTRADAERMDRMFRESALMCEKWDDPRSDTTWGAQQIEKIIATVDAVYEPHEHAEQARPASHWRDRIQSVQELKRKVIVPRPFVVHDILPSGLSMLAARPKMGKSMFSLQIGYRVGSGKGAVLGKYRPMHKRVLYIALEDHAGRMQERLNKMFPGNDPDVKLDIVYEWTTMRAGGLDELTEYVEAFPDTGLIVIDTYALFVGDRGNKSGYREDYREIQTLARWSHEHCSILTLTHTSKKQPGDYDLDLLQDTTGISAGADSIMVMKKVDGIVTLSRQGRDYDDTEPIKLQFDPETLLWNENENLEAGSAREAVIATLVGVDAPMLPIAISRVSGFNSSTVRSTLKRLLEEASPLVAYDEHGRYYLTSRGETNDGTAERAAIAAGKAARADALDDGKED